MTCSELTRKGCPALLSLGSLTPLVFSLILMVCSFPTSAGNSLDMCRISPLRKEKYITSPSSVEMPLGSWPLGLSWISW